MTDCHDYCILYHNIRLMAMLSLQVLGSPLKQKHHDVHHSVYVWLRHDGLEPEANTARAFIANF